jgi:formylglycine-generating enzyme required for sulfatase activity
MSTLIENYDPQELDRAMVQVPEGSFTFGLKPQQKAELAQNAGVHPDMLHFHSDYRELRTPAFWIDRHPVTRGQFLRFMQQTGYEILYNGWLVGWTELTGWKDFQPENFPLPMVGVNSVDAEAYAKWVGKRLPTEVEWEKAWRGTDGRLYPWGDSWEEGGAFRNPGNTSLRVSMPVGCLPDVGPYGTSTYGLVAEWVKTVFQPRGKDGKASDQNPFVLAGGSFCHTRQYSFLPTNRLSWSHHMRIYDSGFRCVSDGPPAGLVRNPRYAVSAFELPKPVRMRPDLYLKESVRLVPTNWATFSVFVPWFPESVWVLDCPEGDWDEFGGANSWPSRPEAQWRIPWKSDAKGSRIEYVREQLNKRAVFEAWADGHTVNYRFEIRNVLPVRAGSFCLKTFSPFFSSQERCTQAKVRPGKTTPCCSMPIPADSPTSFFWSLGELVPPDRAAFVSYDGKGMMLFPEGNYFASGNGWPPCTHITPGGWGTGGSRSAEAGLIEKTGSGSFSFVMTESGGSRS